MKIFKQILRQKTYIIIGTVALC